jgi:hypothetical protein
MDIQELTAARMQKLYEFGEIEFERTLLKQQLKNLNAVYSNTVSELIDIENQINTLSQSIQNTEKISD